MRALVLCVSLLLPSLVFAQDDRTQTLADLRQDMAVLYVEIQRLRRELSTTGGPQVSASGSSVQARLDALESALTDLTNKTEALELRVKRVVADGTRRIGDLEFRLVELEGGDISQLGETSTLGGEEVAVALPEPVGETTEAAPELAVGEEADFNRALAALEDGDPSAAAGMFAVFLEVYPGSPLSPSVHFQRGRALDELGQTRQAAISYLDAYSADPEGPDAPEVLYRLGAALGALEQLDEACLTLAEVGTRFPETPAVAEAEAERARLNCP